MAPGLGKRPGCPGTEPRHLAAAGTRARDRPFRAGCGAITFASGEVMEDIVLGILFRWFGAVILIGIVAALLANGWEAILN
jgi:hypothetical protein